jgi:hypothetical protein
MSSTPDAVGTGSWADLKPGRKVGPLTYVITPEAVRAYCAALAVPPEDYLAPEDGPPVAPPTLLATAYSALLRPYLDLGHGLMARHAAVAHKPVRIGDTVSVTGEVTETFEKKGRHYWTLRYEVRDRQGDLCVTNQITCSVD